MSSILAVINPFLCLRTGKKCNTELPDHDDRLDMQVCSDIPRSSLYKLAQEVSIPCCSSSNYNVANTAEKRSD